MKQPASASAAAPVDFSDVTELANDEVSREQLQRAANRYYWAGEYCRGKDVLEVACGVGQGLGYLASIAKSVRAGDITPALVKRAQTHYGARIPIEVMDALALPLGPASVDVVILFEAIYYLSAPERFVAECRRVLRPGGRVLVVAANKDLPDFNPSPFAQRGYGVAELNELFAPRGFACEFSGDTRIDQISLRQKLLRPVKVAAVRLNLIPKTMSGKKFLKRLVFGRLTLMPAEIDANTAEYVPPTPLPAGRPVRNYKVIHLSALLQAEASAAR